MTSLLPVQSSDIDDAFDHIENLIEPTALAYNVNMRVSAPSLVSIESLDAYDDLVGWLEFDDEELVGLSYGETLSELSTFRGSAWAERALKWKKPEDIPPIVIVDSDMLGVTTIADGRGRVNYAIAMGFSRIPAVFVTDN